MLTIHKFPLSKILYMPMSAKILCVQVQDGKPYIWAEIETDAPKRRISIEVFGTGQELPSTPMEYIGSYQDYHVYKNLDV